MCVYIGVCVIVKKNIMNTLKEPDKYISDGLKLFF